MHGQQPDLPFLMMTFILSTACASPLVHGRSPCRQRERRIEEEKLRKVKTLGEAADDVDDVAAWANKSRAIEESAKAEARAKALKAAQALEEQV